MGARTWLLTLNVLPYVLVKLLQRNRNNKMVVVVCVCAFLLISLHQDSSNIWFKLRGWGYGSFLVHKARASAVSIWHRKPGSFLESCWCFIHNGSLEAWAPKSGKGNSSRNRVNQKSAARGETSEQKTDAPPSTMPHLSGKLPEGITHSLGGYSCIN